MQAFSGKEVPLVPGTLRLYRGWHPLPPGLQAYNFNYIWKDGWNEADCRVMDRVPTAYRAVAHQQPTPNPYCTCGFYARYNPMDREGGSTGVIEVAGRVILGTRGVRAEKARIVAHGWVPEDIQALYPSVKFFWSREDMWAEYPPPDVSELIGPQEPERPEWRYTGILQNQLTTEQVLRLYKEWNKSA